MAVLRFKNVGIRAMAACVPSNIVSNESLREIMPEEEVQKVIKSVGIKERRICDENTTASDLCYEAAKKLLKDNQIDPQSVDMILFMSQVADYRMPATSCILQNKLGLSKRCAAMDLSLACSGFVYALSAAFAYASIEGINRILLLDGESLTKVVNKKDKVNAPLYGDAGTATLIEKGDFEDSIFILNTDGSGENAVKIPAGIRNKITTESLVVTEREDGNFRNDIEIYMDGMEVFNFALRVVPKSVKEILSITGMSLDEVNYIIFHQSNRFMTDFFVKKLKADTNKIPYSIDRFGNTSSASIPLTIVSELQGRFENTQNVIMCGFGAGLSWGTAFLTFNNCHISDLVEYGNS